MDYELLVIGAGTAGTNAAKKAASLGAQHDGVQDVDARLSLEGTPPAQALIEHAAEGPDVGPEIHLFSARLLRAHVGGRCP